MSYSILPQSAKKIKKKKDYPLNIKVLVPIADIKKNHHCPERTNISTKSATITLIIEKVDKNIDSSKKSI